MRSLAVLIPKPAIRPHMSQSRPVHILNNHLLRAIFNISYNLILGFPSCDFELIFPLNFCYQFLLSQPIIILFKYTKMYNSHNHSVSLFLLTPLWYKHYLGILNTCNLCSALKKNIFHCHIE